MGEGSEKQRGKGRKKREGKLTSSFFKVLLLLLLLLSLPLPLPLLLLPPSSTPTFPLNSSSISKTCFRYRDMVALQGAMSEVLLEAAFTTPSFSAMFSPASAE